MSLEHAAAVSSGQGTCICRGHLLTFAFVTEKKLESLVIEIMGPSSCWIHNDTLNFLLSIL